MAETRTWLDISLSRGPIKGPLRNNVGLILDVRADPMVEDFFQGKAGGKVTAVEALGPSWIPIAPTEKLESYVIDKGAIPGNAVTLANVGRPLLIDTRGIDMNGSLKVNLSFLMLKDISKGLRVGVLGAYSMDFINKFNRDAITEGDRFFRDYIVPISVNLRIVSNL